jgi:hypothetical protein
MTGTSMEKKLQNSKRKKEPKKNTGVEGKKK